jgi:hypothetical protein
MKRFLLVLAMVLMASWAFAADVNLKWDAVTGATGYKIYMSLDNCATWLAPKDVGNVITYTYVGVSDTVLVHFKVSAYKAGGVETVTNFMGAWWDTRLMPLGTPVSLGIK